MIDVKQEWRELRRQQPMARARDFARERNITEAELVAAFCGDGTVHLTNAWPAILKELPALGRVMALTRNEYAVHECKGQYNKPQFYGPAGQIVGEDIDLRFFPSQWQHGFAVREDEKRSLQFFDKHGVALHKIFLLPESDVAAFEKLVAAHTNTDQTPSVDVTRAAAHRREDASVDVLAFQAAWDALQDTHDFYGLLKKFRLRRTQALRVSRPDQAQRVNPSSLGLILREASAAQQPIMVFVGNDGIIQIHTGNVTNIVAHGPWLNVLDEDFNLHIREDLIAEAWRVRKPTRDGMVTSLELFAGDDELIAQLFGKRKPGQEESKWWRALAERFPQS